MYCIIGDKILRCEVISKQEDTCLCKVGKAGTSKHISNKKLFDTEAAANSFLLKREKNKQDADKKISEDITKCEALYNALFEETGITVRLIDRRFRVKEAESQIAHLRKKYNKRFENQEDKPREATDSRKYSTKSSSAFRAKEPADKKNTRQPQYFKKK